jgi:hypothetical protein
MPLVTVLLGTDPAGDGCWRGVSYEVLRHSDEGRGPVSLSDVQTTLDSGLRRNDDEA